MVLACKERWSREFFRQEQVPMGLVLPSPEEGVGWVTEAERTGVHREWAFDMPLLACFQVTGPVELG